MDSNFTTNPKIYMKTFITLSVVFCITNIQNAKAGTPIDVVENTLKIKGSGEEVFYYGFAAGDQLIFNFEEVNGKELKEVEIIEMPGSSKFMAYKSKKVENKILHIQRTGIYKFRLANSAMLSGRICKIKIQRIPRNNETVDFNTSVYFRKVFDTTYVNRNEKFLISSDTSVAIVQESDAKVHSELSGKGNVTTIPFNLPDGTIAWSYYIGVDQEGRQAYEAAQKGIDKNRGTLTAIATKLSPVGALALGLPSFLNHINGKEAVRYQVINVYQPNPFLSQTATRVLKQNNASTDFARMEPVAGSFVLSLANGNSITAISAMVRIEAVVVMQEWGNRLIPQMKVKEREEMYLEGNNL